MSHYPNDKDPHGLDEKTGVYDVTVTEPDHHALGDTVGEDVEIKNDLKVTGQDLEELEAKASGLSMERTRHIIGQLYHMHKNDQNFPRPVLDRMEEFLALPPGEESGHHEKDFTGLVREMKIEAILSTENSPYLEVRANVDPTDDPTLPTLTFRVLVMGTIFAAIGSFIDGVFTNRQPSVVIGANVAQLVAYPIGKFMARVLPTKQHRTFGVNWSLNPGPFNNKEHMMITIMCNVSFNASYTAYIIPTQALPFFFNMPFARKIGYQLLNCLATNFVGYGLAGLCRRFLVYPSVAVWPSSLAQIALNKAFHSPVNEAVKGPFNRWYKMSREKFFLLAFLAMFCYFWLPGLLFPALSYFSWITWIAPNNVRLTDICGSQSGMGINPWPTFDWNILNPNGNVTLTIPTFSFMNQFIGMIAYTLMSIAIYYKNAWNTGYLPINTNHTFDNTGAPYNVSKILDDKGNFDNEKFQAYSEPWMGSAYIVAFAFYFAMYSATLFYVAIYHRHEIAIGFKGAWRSFRRTFKKGNHVEELDQDELGEDVHYRLMQAYPEVPEWQYGIVLLISMVLGMIGVGIYPTQVTPAVVIFGVIMPLIVMIPCGLVQAVTGIPIPLNVLSEFIGGAIVPGNANALMYFKTYGYISAYQALLFSNDLKMAHYLKLPPRHTFYMQIWASLIYCFVAAGIQNFILGFKDVCTSNAAFGMSCPGSNTFFTSAVFWGTLGPKRLFGNGMRYNMMLLGFPAGAVLVLALWGIRRVFPRSEWLRQLHPVMITAGPAYWAAPYNMSYLTGNIYITLLSFQYVRKRYTAFWAKYNYVLAAAFPAGIAVATLVIFFALQIPKNGAAVDKINWWGVTVLGEGCDGAGGCPMLTVPEGSYFGGAPGTFST